MKLPQATLLQATAGEVADILFEESQALFGEPVERSSWLEIAEFIVSRDRLASLLLMYLQAAVSQEDVLEVLYAVRNIKSNLHPFQERGIQAKPDVMEAWEAFADETWAKPPVQENWEMFEIQRYDEDGGLVWLQEDRIDEDATARRGEDE